MHAIRKRWIGLTRWGPLLIRDADTDSGQIIFDGDYPAEYVYYKVSTRTGNPNPSELALPDRGINDGTCLGAKSLATDKTAASASVLSPSRSVTFMDLHLSSTDKSILQTIQKSSISYKVFSKQL